MSTEQALRRFAGRERVLVALDFDGVLAPIVAVPDQARALPEAAQAVAALAAAEGVRLALVSGRRLADLRQVATPPPGALLVGSHGVEVSFDGVDATPTLEPEQQDLLARICSVLQEIVARHPGTALENKPFGAVLHTRQAQRPVAEEAARQTLAGPARWPGVHVTQGKEVVELAVLDVTKGTALTSLRARLDLPSGSGGVLYIGDDVTDERAFAALDDDTGDLTVKVGAGQTRARHRVDGPAEVAVLLQRLTALRP